MRVINIFVNEELFARMKADKAIKQYDDWASYVEYLFEFTVKNRSLKVKK